MKHVLLLLIVLLLALGAIPIQAQPGYYGITGGLTISEVRLDTKMENEEQVLTRNGYGIGGSMGFALAPYLHLQAELMYLKKGAEIGQQPPDQDFDINLSYFELPVLLKVNFGRDYPYILVGPSFGYLWDASGETNYNGRVYHYDFGDVFKKFDMGLTIGGGVALKTGKFDVLLEGRYSFGLLDISKSGRVKLRSENIIVSDDWQDTVKATNRGFQMMLGLIFPIAAE